MFAVGLLVSVAARRLARLRQRRRREQRHHRHRDVRGTVEGVTWTLTELNGEAPPEGVEATLVFDGSTVSGSSGCNTYSGEATFDEDVVEISDQLTSTMIACEARGRRVRGRLPDHARRRVDLRRQRRHAHALERLRHGVGNVHRRLTACRRSIGSAQVMSAAAPSSTSRRHRHQTAGITACRSGDHLGLGGRVLGVVELAARCAGRRAAPAASPRRRRRPCRGCTDCIACSFFCTALI